MKKKNDMSKVKCFVCHKCSHYSSQYLKWKKGKSKSQQVAASVEAQVKEFVEKFEKDFHYSLVFLAQFSIVPSSWIVGLFVT